MRILLPYGLLFSPVQRVLDVVNNPRALANNYMVDFDHPHLGKVKMPGYPIHFSKSWAGLCTIGPNIVGEHTNQVMEAVGYTARKND